MFKDTNALCTARDVAQLKNIFFDGPHENLDQHDHIHATQGTLFCDVEKSPYPAQASDPKKIWVYKIGSKKIEIFMANVECWLYADQGIRSQRLDRVIKALQEVRTQI